MELFISFSPLISSLPHLVYTSTILLFIFEYPRPVEPSVMKNAVYTHAAQYGGHQAQGGERSLAMWPAQPKEYIFNSSSFKLT